MRFDTEGDSLKNEKRKRSSSVYLLSLSLSLKRIRALSPHEAANRPQARRRKTAVPPFCFPLSLYSVFPSSLSISLSLETFPKKLKDCEIRFQVVYPLVVMESAELLADQTVWNHPSFPSVLS